MLWEARRPVESSVDAYQFGTINMSRLRHDIIVSTQSSSASSTSSFFHLKRGDYPSIPLHYSLLLIMIDWLFHGRSIDDLAEKIRKQPELCHRRSTKHWRHKARRSILSWKILYLSLIAYLGIPSIIRGQDSTIEPSTDAPSADDTTIEPGGNETEIDFPSFTPSQLSDGNSTDDTPSPTITGYPTALRSDSPSGAPSSSALPSDTPSASPTARPTYDEPSIQDARFRQKFLVANGRVFTDPELLLFQGLFRSYTANFAPAIAVATDQIQTTCTVDAQEGLVGRRLRYRDWRVALRILQSEPIQAVNVDYTMMYESRHFNVTTYPLLFQDWVNTNLVTVTGQMQLLQLNVTEALTASRIIFRTPAPSISFAPSYAPSPFPSQSAMPSSFPSEAPSENPSDPMPPTSPPSSAPSGATRGVVVITVSILVGLTIIAIGLLIYCRKRRHTREMDYQADAMKTKQQPEVATLEGEGVAGSVPQTPNNDPSESPESTNYGLGFRKYSDGASGNGLSGVVSPSESLVSNQSLLSAGNSMAEDSGDEVDTTQIFADEFDQYKDQNLEKMRADIEGNLEGCDGMMSQAVARALIDEDDLTLGTGDYYWGGDENVTGPEIEASALGDVMDRLKLDENASVEEKRAFMQETLNKMVASVRLGVLGPDDASRTIHECAALLGLQLAEEIPEATVVISGLRKKATAQDIINTFSEFGPIATAAVAPNERGFGILRFKSREAVDRAMNEFRTNEVVVEDVAVQLKVIEAGTDNQVSQDSGGQ